MAAIKRIVLVGHCGPDAFMLKSTVSRLAPGVAIESADDQATLAKLADGQSLLLINRVLSYGFDTTNGVELIRHLVDGEDGPKLMLISNYPDAQQQASEAGALAGFGKSELGKPQTAAKITAALG